MTTPTTTAAKLAAYRHDLIAEGIGDALADAIVLDAASHLHRQEGAPTIAGVTADEVAAKAAERRARRQAELEEVSA